MFNNCYFFVFKIEKVSEEKSLPPYVLKYIRKYLSKRFKKINYFEPFTSAENMVTAVILGSEKVHQTANRNVLIFMLELYASLKDPNISITSDFKKKIKKIKNVELEIYKFKKFKQ